MRGILFILIAFSSFRSYTQETSRFAELEDSLAFYLKEIRDCEDFECRYRTNRKFLELFRFTLEQKGVYEYPFDSLYISNIKSPDGKFRIFNWNIPKDDGHHLYYCFFLKERKGKSPQLYELTQKTHLQNRKFETKVLGEEDWYGALYYKIIFKKHRGISTYTLLGWDGNNGVTQKKIIDIVSFTRRG